MFIFYQFKLGTMWNYLIFNQNLLQCYLQNATMMRHAWMMGNEDNLPNLNIPTSVQCIYFFFKKGKSCKMKFSWLKIWCIFFHRIISYLHIKNIIGSKKL